MQQANQIADPDLLAEKIYSSTSVEELLKLIGGRTYTEYANDPVAFGEDLLGKQFTEEVQELMLSVRDNVITVAISANGTGKTHAAGGIALWWHKSFKESKVYTSAAPPLDNLETLLWGEIGSTITKNQDLFNTDERKNLYLGKTEEYFLKGVTIPSSGTKEERVSKFSGKHAPYLLFILDEGDAIPDEVYEGIETCMSGGHCRLLIMFNPKQRMGEAYRMIQEGRANVVKLTAFGHPNVITGKDIIPGAVNRETTVRRMNQWSRPWVEGESWNEDNSYIVPDFLEGATAQDPATKRPFQPLVGGQRRIITNPALSYMTLGQYPAMGTTQLISSEWIYRARSRWDDYVLKMGEVFPEGVRPVMGLDAAAFGPDSNCVYFRAGGYVSKAKKWNKVDPLVTGDMGSKEYRNANAIACFVDANGVGAGVAPHMRRLGCNAHSVLTQERATQETEMGRFGVLRDQLAWLLREWLRADPGAMLPPDEQLIEELMVPTYEIIKGRVKVMDKDTMKEKLKRSPDNFDSLCLTFAETTPEDDGVYGTEAARPVVVANSGWAT